MILKLLWNIQIHNVYNPPENYNSNKKRKVLIVFDDMIADMINYKKLNLVVTDLFQQIAINHSSDVDFKDFMKIYKKCRTILFLVNDTTLSSDDPFRFRKNLLETRLERKIYNMILTERLQKYQLYHQVK